MIYSGTEHDINSVLLSLGVIIDPEGFKNGRMLIICPYHSDRNLGSAYIKSDSKFKCWSCGAYADLIQIVIDIKKCTFKEALIYIGQTKYLNPFPEFEGKRKQKEVIPKVYKNALLFNLKTVEFDPLEFEYTRSRGFTKEFVDYFKIKWCLEGWYKDYMIIPLKEADTFEARKLKEKEVLTEFFKLKRNVDLKILRKKYKEWRKSHKESSNDFVEYLSKGKTLYPKHTLIDKPIIFNQYRLKKDEDLYIVEGVSGIPKIWSYISKNVTATFGSEISDNQIRILNTFTKKKIIIPDNDTASLKMISRLSANIEKIYVLPKELDDTNPDYVEHVQNLKDKTIEGSRFVLRKVLD